MGVYSIYIKQEQEKERGKKMKRLEKGLYAVQGTSGTHYRIQKFANKWFVENIITGQRISYGCSTLKQAREIAEEN